MRLHALGKRMKNNPAELKKEIQDMLADKLSLEKIAKTIGCRKDNLKNAMAKLGITEYNTRFALVREKPEKKYVIHSAQREKIDEERLQYALVLRKFKAIPGESVRITGEFVSGATSRAYERQTRTGRIYSANNRMFVVDFGLYKMSWTWVDYSIGNVKVASV